MHDAIQIETLGTPATIVITEPFENIVDGFGANLGMHDYPRVTVPHPVSNKNETELQEIADSIVDKVAKNLTSSDS